MLSGKPMAKTIIRIESDSGLTDADIEKAKKERNFMPRMVKEKEIVRRNLADQFLYHGKIPERLWR